MKDNSQLQAIPLDEVTPYMLAREFAGTLSNLLGRHELSIISDVNKFLVLKDGTCATYGFCDSKKAMTDAFKALTGIESDPQSNKHNLLIQKAWAIAKQKDFFIKH